MNKKLNSLIFLTLSISILIVFFSTAGNTDTQEAAQKTYPVKVHLSGITQGETITFYVDGSSPQARSSSQILLNMDQGKHSICVTSTDGKWGNAEFNVEPSSYVRDVYVELSLNNQPCQNTK